MSDEEIKTLEDVDGDIEQLEKIVVNEDSEILVGMTINDKEVFVEIGIEVDEAMRLLKSIGYGSIGWEKYKIVDVDNRSPEDY